MRTSTVLTAALATWLAAWGTSTARGGSLDPLQAAADPPAVSAGVSDWALPTTIAPAARPECRSRAAAPVESTFGMETQAAPLPDPEPEGALIPEPSSALLLTIGLLAATRRRRRA